MKAKEEFHNPGMSSKDRPALFMMEDAIREGKINSNGVFVEASSGNTGLSIAMLAKEKGFKAKIFVSQACSIEKRNALLSYGADLVICTNSNGPNDPQSTQYAAKQFADQHEEAFFTDQYYNPANVKAHYETTGPELWEQTSGQITHFIAGIGTGGTITGIGRFLKQQNKNIRIIGIEPKNSIYKYYLQHKKLPQPQPPKHDAIEGIGRTFLPGTFDAEVVDQVFQVGENESRQTALWYKEKAGALTGFSTAAVITAIRNFHLEMELNKNSLLVALFPDHGGRYISKLFDGNVS